MPEQKFPPLLAKFTYLSNFSFLHFLCRTYNVFFISIILLILKVKILAPLYEHGTENIWIREKNIFLYIIAINWMCCQFLQHYAAAASEGASPRRNFWTSPRMQTSFWNSQTANFPRPLIFKEFNIKMLPICTIFVCHLFMERENSFWAKLPLEIEIFLYCNKISIPLWRVYLKTDKYQLKTRRCEDYFLNNLFPFN